MELLSWDTWSIPLASCGLALLIVLPLTFARPLWERHRERRVYREWLRAQEKSPLEAALAEARTWDGYLPEWVVDESC